MASKRHSTVAVVDELRVIRDRIDSLIETFEVTSDKRLLAEIKESLREAEEDKGRPISELIRELEEPNDN